MDNSNCYWCDYLVDKINTSEEGYYCTFNPEELRECKLDEFCLRYVNAEKIPEYLRYLFKEIELMEQMYRLP